MEKTFPRILGLFSLTMPCSSKYWYHWTIPWKPGLLQTGNSLLSSVITWSVLWLQTPAWRREKERIINKIGYMSEIFVVERRSFPLIGIPIEIRTPSVEDFGIPTKINLLLIQGFSTIFHGGRKEVPKYLLKGQIMPLLELFLNISV